MKTRKGSVSYLLLLALEKSIDGVVRIEDFTYHSYKYFGATELPNLKKHSVSEAIKRLRLEGLVDKSVDNEGKVILTLTKLGRDLFEEDEKWDGKYRIVIWDIPEKNRRVRDLFRRKLREWEFRVIQKSVWASKKNVTVKLNKLIEDLNMSSSIVIIESDDRTLEKYFKTSE